ncbi:MAG: hypothetical protein IPG71_11260 [bacterium]|nr:hypothetical protein [bacterium]
MLDQRAAAGLTEFLVAKLGPKAICAHVDVSWRSIALEDILLPLDDYGSHVSIQRIEAAIDPLVALAQPGQFERIIRGVNIVRPEVVLQSDRPKSEGGGLSGVPQTVYDFLDRVDSLRYLTFGAAKSH